MSFLADIHAYWHANSTLDAALSHNNVWTGLVPESQAFPYAVITAIALSPTFTTGTGYYATFDFQIQVFDTDPDNVEALDWQHGRLERVRLRLGWVHFSRPLVAGNGLSLFMPTTE